MAEVIEMPTCDICNRALDGTAVSGTKQMTDGTTSEVRLHKICLLEFKLTKQQEQLMRLAQQLGVAHQMICTAVHRFGGRLSFTKEDITAAMEATNGEFEVEPEEDGRVSLTTSKIVKPNGVLK